jgi:Zn finger protein HypA/HybF involved in hydrogenase expression
MSYIINRRCVKCGTPWSYTPSDKRKECPTCERERNTIQLERDLDFEWDDIQGGEG